MGVHSCPQVPQFFGSWVVRASQPFSATLSQSSKPASQLLTLQLPAVQLALPWFTTQMFPHAPQLLGSASSATSQPSVRSKLQLPKPDAQPTITQLPASHAAIAPGI